MLAALVLVVALLAVALSVDLGRIHHESARARLQADAAALAGSRSLGPCTASPVDPLPAVLAAAQANGWSGGLNPDSVQVGDVAVQDGYRVFAASGDIASASAVRVSLSRATASSRLLPALLTGTVDVRAVSVARARAVAGIRVRSTLASIDSTQATLLNQIFGALLGSAVSLSAGGYQGLVDSSVTLQELADASAAGLTADQLLETEMTGGALLGLVAGALGEQGDPGAASAQALSQASTTVEPIAVGDVIAGDLDDDASAADARLSAFDLAMAVALASRESSTVTVSSLAVTLPGVTSTDLVIAVIRSPELAIGPPGRDSQGHWRTSVRGGDVRAQLTLAVTSPITVGALVGANVSLGAYLDSHGAIANLETIQCPRAAAPSSQVVVGLDPVSTRIGLGRFADPIHDAEPTPMTAATLKLAGLPIARVDVEGEVTADAAAETLVFDGPFVPELDIPSSDNTQFTSGDLDGTVTSLATELAASPGVTVTLLGTLPLGVTKNSIASAALVRLVPVVNALPSALQPVAELLGLQVGGAAVTVTSLNYSQPELVQ